MSWGFFLVSMSIMLPFGLLAFGMQVRRRNQRQQELVQLLRRVGLSSYEQKSIRDRWQAQKERAGMIWLASRFKKAGMNDPKEVVRWSVVQSVLVFISAFALATQYHAMNEKLLMLVLMLPLTPAAYLFYRIHQRQTQMRKDFPEMLDSIVRSLQSGYGIDGALNAVGEDMKGPLAEEFRELNKQLTLGVTMRDILREFQRRVDLQEAHFFVMTLIIQRETGGQLSAILTELSKLMRRRERFQAKLKTLTAESRFTAWFIGGAPVLYVLYKYFFDPESMDFFLNDPLGFKLFLVSLSLIAAGTLILRQMLKMRF